MRSATDTVYRVSHRRRGYAPAPMICATPLVLAALSGTGPVHHPGVVDPPWSNPSVAPPASGKSVWGAALDNQVSSDNFTVGWDDGDGDTAAAERVLGALEVAWTSLVETQGWTAPRSSDDFLLWVVLDPSIGHTGYTTLLFDGDFPDGVPVVYMNPDYTVYGTFWEHLAVHEFNHALQYAVRKWNGGSSEAWYWEASAEWGAELATPELDVYALQAAYYAAAPEVQFDTVNGGHEYGMFVLNAWLEEHLLGEGGLRDVWLASRDRPGDDWLEILEEETGWEAGALWAAFTAALGNDDLREAGLYDDPILQGVLAEGSSGRLAHLGTDYWTVEADALVTVDGDALLGSPAGQGEAVVALAGEVLTVTALKQNANYSLGLGEVPDPVDSGDTGPPADSDSVDPTGVPDDEGVGCGCSQSPSPPPLWPLIIGLGVLARRSRSVATPGGGRV